LPNPGESVPRRHERQHARAVPPRPPARRGGAAGTYVASSGVAGDPARTLAHPTGERRPWSRPGRGGRPLVLLLRRREGWLSEGTTARSGRAPPPARVRAPEDPLIVVGSAHETGL